LAPLSSLVAKYSSYYHHRCRGSIFSSKCTKNVLAARLYYYFRMQSGCFFARGGSLNWGRERYIVGVREEK